MHRPRFQPHFRVEVLEEGVFLFSEGPAVVLDGRLYRQVAPLIDGRRSVDEIVAAIDTVDPAYVHWTLSRLAERGYIAEAPRAPEESGHDAMALEHEALWTSEKIAPADALARLTASGVRIEALGVDDDPIRSALSTAGVRLVSTGAAMTVVVVDDYLRRDLEAINAEALRTGRPWMLARPVGTEIWLGPIFRPEATGCWECLASRLRGNRGPEWYVRERRGRPRTFPVARACSPATLQVAHGMLATEIAGFIARGSSPLEGRVLTLDVRTWQSRSHSLVRRPQCPTCGDPAPKSPRAVELTSVPYLTTQDGGLRSVSAESTIARYEHHLSPITGALLGVERIGPSDGVSHVYFAGPNNARLANGSFEGLRFDLRNKNSGKGTTDANARASAIGEGLERYSGVFQGDEPRRSGRFRDFGGDAIHPNDCMLFSARQYEDRDAWNSSKWRLDYVPVPFDANREIEWTPVWSLTRRAFRYLPTAYCWYSYPHVDAEQYCVACSTGNAAGNTIEEAILQGFFELVERDAVGLWWYSRLQRPEVDLDAFDDPYIRRIRSTYETQRKRSLWALDLTTDFGIPVVAAVSRRTDGPSEKIMFGFGAHLDRRVATLRAITELNQMLAMFLPGTGEERGPEPNDPAPTIKWLQTATLATERYLVPDAGAAPMAHSLGPSGDLRTDVLACQAAVESKGLEMLVLDQTRPDIGLPVVKVIVPGLRHFWARFAPGRLYDAPVRMGWLDRPLREEELNPTPMFL